jgi:hypothetical protein
VFVVKLEIPMKGLGVEAASRHAETMGELVRCLEYGIRNGDGGLHTTSIPLVVVQWDRCRACARAPFL